MLIDIQISNTEHFNGFTLNITIHIDNIPSLGTVDTVCNTVTVYASCIDQIQGKRSWINTLDLWIQHKNSFSQI